MSHATSDDHKTLIVGFDGMDWRYVDRFSTELEHLPELKERGVAAELTSTHPPWTGSAWPSMYTGTSPDHHGVYDFFDYSGCYPDAATVVTRSDVKAPALWNYLTERDVPSLVLNVPVTHPAERIHGVLVPGYLAPEDEPGHPNGIRDDIANAIGEPYTIYSDFETASETDRKVDGYVELIQRRGAAAEYLIESTDWKLAVIQFQKTDAVFHNSDRPDHFERVYATADRALGRILDACSDETNVIVCSDHGMGPVDGYQIHVNQILEELGYITTTTDVGVTGSPKPFRRDDSEDTGIADDVADRMIRVASKAGLSPRAAYRVADRLGVADSIVRAAPDWVRDSVARGVSWDESIAYCRRQTEQGIRINVRGRDPSGVVDPEDYEAIRTEIIDRLTDLRTPDGEPAFEFVCRREELYDGPYTDDACDVLFRTNGMRHAISPKLYGIRYYPLDSYDHRRNGVFVAAGPDIDATADVDRLALTDVAPLAMVLLGHPVPERMTGSVPDELVTTHSASRMPYDTAIDGSTAYTQDQDDVRNRLRDLGYL